MGGKGQRRREKNFRAAHGSYTRLPPPPKPSEIDALPSKLRKLMEFITPAPNNPSTTKGSDGDRKRKNRDAIGEKKPNLKDESCSKIFMFKEGCNGDLRTPKDDTHETIHDKRKAKRKRKQVNDLRFEASRDLGAVGLKRRDRKKQYWEARKKKHKKAKTEENLDFPTHEEIKFGEVVEAPPKLVTFPKALKTVQNASHERLRLQAVEAYRNRKGWVSRPGIHLPPIAANSSS